MTPEQEQYEFPPRSRLLKKLATSTAELRRISVLQDHVVPSAPDSPIADPTPAPSYQSFTINPATISTEMKQPDQLALSEWFSKKENRSIPSKVNKDRAVIDWMNDVERSSKTLLNNKKYQHLNPVKPSPTPSSVSNKIQFKSDAGKRWANLTSNSSLLPPDDTCRKHYVPRRLLKLQQHRQMQDKADCNTSSRTSKRFNSDEENEVTEEAASKIQQIWKDYQSKSTAPSMIENQVGIAAMATTGQRTPIAGMVHLVQMLHHSLKVQRQKSHDRMAKLEMLLEEETKKRQEAEETMKMFYHRNSKSHQKEKVYQTLLNRVTDLELSVKRDGHSKITPATSSAASVSSSSATLAQRYPQQRRRTLVPANNMNSSKMTMSAKNSSGRATTKDRTSSLANAGITRKPSTHVAPPPLMSTPRRRPPVPISRSKK